MADAVRYRAEVLEQLLVHGVRPTAHTSRRAIIDALELAHEAGVDYWSGYTTPEFFAPMDSHWSAAEHVRHLTRSMTPLLPVLRVPRVALRFAFGCD